MSGFVGPVAPAAGSLNVRLLSQTNMTVTLAWTPIPDCGYRFSIDRTVVSNTWDEKQAKVTFAKLPYQSAKVIANWTKVTGKTDTSGLHEYGVEAVAIGLREFVAA